MPEMYWDCNQSRSVCDTALRLAAKKVIEKRHQKTTIAVRKLAKHHQNRRELSHRLRELRHELWVAWSKMPEVRCADPAIRNRGFGRYMRSHSKPEPVAILQAGLFTDEPAIVEQYHHDVSTKPEYPSWIQRQ